MMKIWLFQKLEFFNSGTAILPEQVTLLVLFYEICYIYRVMLKLLTSENFQHN